MCVCKYMRLSTGLCVGGLWMFTPAHITSNMTVIYLNVCVW